MVLPHDFLPAQCFQLDGQTYLASGPSANELAAGGQVVFSPVYVRYAFPQYGTLQPFFPALAADDRGKQYRGLDAIDWIANYGLLYPRADVAGLWPDGREDQFVIRELDLGLALLVYVSASEWELPGSPLTAAFELVVDADFALAPGGNFPARIGAAIPIFQLNAALPFSKTRPLIPQVAAAPQVISLESIG